MNRRNKQALRAAFSPPPPQHKQAFLNTLQAPSAGIWAFTQAQILYIRPRIWIVDLCLLLFALFTAGQSADFSRGDFSGSVWTIASILPVLVLCLATELARSGVFAMSELELSCKHNLLRILLARMGILGLSNFLLLLCVQAALYSQSGFGFFRFGIYLYSPLFLSAFGCLLALNRVKQGDVRAVCAGICGSVCLGGLICFGDGIYLLGDAYFPYWCGILLALFAGIAAELYRFVKLHEECALQQRI